MASSDHHIHRSVLFSGDTRTFDSSDHGSFASSVVNKKVPPSDCESQIRLPDRRSQVADFDKSNKVYPSHFKDLEKPLDRTWVIEAEQDSRVDPSHFKSLGEPFDYKNFVRLSGRRYPVVPSEHRTAAAPLGDSTVDPCKQLRLADRVTAAGVKSGVLRFYGETEFADASGAAWCWTKFRAASTAASATGRSTSRAVPGMASLHQSLKSDCNPPRCFRSFLPTPSRSGGKVVCGSPEEGTVAGATDFLFPIAEILDELDEGSKQESLGILTDGAIRDATLSFKGLSVIPNSFSTDDVADLPKEE
ncbi:hypothetical protein HPB47_002683 [Ixodes persulcatus]|uniref:Uncharacterized protein n=1 Tax=Ixodes persulcatus TaxID=34615 RepID=A0AC60PLP3_IXOPE|nr:hypothetical protein HPB47_002683 [Ixodes persulcatus]